MMVIIEDEFIHLRVHIWRLFTDINFTTALSLPLAMNTEKEVAVRSKRADVF
jgi:hypothetical protein